MMRKRLVFNLDFLAILAFLAIVNKRN